jgi:guanylate kinase
MKSCFWFIYFAVCIVQSRSFSAVEKMFGRNLSNLARGSLKKANIRLQATASSSSSLNNSGDIKSLVICGPSGVGKGTIISLLLKKYPTACALSVSHTSRRPRQGEQDGVHYHFITREEFHKQLSESGKSNSKYPRFLEVAQVHGQFYGTREDSVTRCHQENMICILDIDTEGVKSLKRLNFPMKSIFLMPPDFTELSERLRKRGTEREDQVILRLKNAQEQIKFAEIPGQFDRLIVNEYIDQTMAVVVKQLEEWFPNHFKKVI